MKVSCKQASRHLNSAQFFMPSPERWPATTVTYRGAGHTRDCVASQVLQSRGGEFRSRENNNEQTHISSASQHRRDRGCEIYRRACAANLGQMFALHSP
jgi:hypothetical protein